MVLYEVIAKLKMKNGVSFDEKGEDVFLKDPRVVVEDTGVQHGNVEFGFRIKKELLEDEKKNAEKHIRDSTARQNKITMPQKS